jgi:hypothetical protein
MTDVCGIEKPPGANSGGGGTPHHAVIPPTNAKKSAKILVKVVVTVTVTAASTAHGEVAQLTATVVAGRLMEGTEAMKPHALATAGFAEPALHVALVLASEGVTTACLAPSRLACTTTLYVASARLSSTAISIMIKRKGRMTMNSSVDVPAHLRRRGAMLFIVRPVGIRPGS